ncbi:reverse transcriptase domain-containing protein [Tanacetum coccineum]
MAPRRRPTVYRNPPVNRSTNRINCDIKRALTFRLSTCSLPQKRIVKHSEAAACDSCSIAIKKGNNLGSNYSEQTCNTRIGSDGIVKFASSTLLDGLLLVEVYVRSVTLDTAHATPWSDFEAMFIRKYCPRNEIKQMENELWNIKVKGTNLTAYNQRFQELILLCPNSVVPMLTVVGYVTSEGLPLCIKGNDNIIILNQ